MHKSVLAGTLLIAIRAPAGAADHARATLDCKAAPSPEFAYDCALDLTNARTSAPLDGATVVLGADMPSMPIVHNVPPFTFKPSGNLGTTRRESCSTCMDHGPSSCA